MQRDVGRFGNELVHAIAKDRERAQARNGHDQATHRCYERLVNSFRQITSTCRTLRIGNLLKRKDHARDSAEQPDHRSDVADD